MADPITLMAAAAAGTKAIGAITGGLSQSAMYKYQAGVAAVNQKIALQNAEYSRSIGESKAEESGMKTRAQLGHIKTAQGASGFQVEGGSATDVRESASMLGRYEQSVIRSNAAKAAYGHEVEALNFGAKAQMASMASKNAKWAGFIDATSSILGGASSVSEKWMQAQTMGMT